MLQTLPSVVMSICSTSAVFSDAWLGLHGAQSGSLGSGGGGGRLVSTISGCVSVIQ